MKSRRTFRTLSGAVGRRRDEKGAILVLSTVGLVLAMIAAALSIDLGTLAQSAREDQKVADLAALDAVRVLPGTFDQSQIGSVTQAAKDSALRNGFSFTSPGYNLLVEWGPSNTGPFTSLPAELGTATAVRVTATSPHKNAFPFVSGPDTVSRKAVAAKKDVAGFTLGSSLANVNSTTSSLLNPIVGSMLGSTVNLSLVSWQGLASGSVTLSALQAELAAMGFNVGSVSELLDANLTLAQLYQATANVMTKNGDTANAAVFNTLKVNAVTATTIKLGRMITVEQGAESAAAGAQLNLLQLVTGSAQLANGTNMISVSDLGISVPNALSVGMTLKVIEGTKIYIGPAGAGPHVTTGQVELILTPQVDILNLLGLVKVTGLFPVDLHAAGATGTLKSVACPSKDIVVTADPKALSGALKSSRLRVTSLSLLHLMDVDQTNSISTAVDGPAQDLAFTYSTEFSPPNDVSKHVGSQPLGIKTPNVVTGTAVNVNLLGLASLGLSAGTVLDAVIAALDTMVGDIDSLVLTPLFKALGITIGGADVTALGIDPFTGGSLPQCGVPALAS